MSPSFHDEFAVLFSAQFARLFRYLDRLSGEPDLAADLAQETFLRLYRRGALPESPDAWLITVALNLFRNARATRRRRARLFTPAQAQAASTDSIPAPDRFLEAEESRTRVRAALDRLAERERALLLLVAEGYAYRDIARALNMRESSVGTLLARAKRAFRAAYEG